MKFDRNDSGLSARQRTITKKVMNFIPQAHTWCIYVLTVGLALSGCNEKSNGQTSADTKTASADSANKPQVNIKVNRHYDDQGNVVSFDSTYTSYYSNVKGDTMQMDSLIHRFDHYFDRNHFSFFRQQFDPLFFNDSTRYPDFFHKDYFLRRYELNDAYMRSMMQRMDSIKNKFYKENSDKNKNRISSR
ncbi:hypothetical protein ACFQ21_00470 [Ohtaekwangia kribbensis]|jgi:hypothetical protein|uniref:Lipoprotein n=1 Tax=Ohtaekwangia kribbensis TaxID=688913 RepID=A0ABW3JX47_9BACT